MSTLHNISNRSVKDLEKELIVFSKNRPIDLILPSLYSEIEGPALKNIIDILSQVKYLNHITIGLDRANKSEFIKAKKFFSKLNQPHSVIWNDSPGMKKIDKNLKGLGLAPDEPGKGKNVWYCMGYVSARGEAKSVALHDCDITTYHRELLARLIYPVANPNFNYEFCKGYYPRITHGTLGGRVSRLLVTPLLKTFKKVLAIKIHSIVFCKRDKRRGKTIALVTIWLLWDAYIAKCETESVNAVCLKALFFKNVAHELDTRCSSLMPSAMSEKISMVCRSHPCINRGCETYAITQSSKNSMRVST